MKRNNLYSRPKLNDKKLMGLEPEGKDYRIVVEDQLYFFVKSTGHKSWQLRYKNIIGVWTWKGLGAYPLVNISQAKKIARTYQNEIENNTFFTNRETEYQKYRLSSLIEEWLDTKIKKWSDKTYEKAVKSIQKHICQKFGARDFRDITAGEWFKFFQGLQRNLKIMTQVNKLLSYMIEVYEWAEISHGIKINPLTKVKKFLDNHKGNNFCSVEIHELPMLLKSIRSYSNKTTGIGLELMLLLFPRPGELSVAKWEHFDLDKRIWTKPAELMKNRRIHKVPLSDQAINLLYKLKKIQRQSDYLFPARNDPNKPICDSTFNTALKRLGYQKKQHAHGFRHLSSTALNKVFSSKVQVIEAALSHVKKGTKGIYDRAEHFEEREELMRWWGNYIDILYNKYYS